MRKQEQELASPEKSREKSRSRAPAEKQKRPAPVQNPLIDLQRSAGNQAVSKLLASGAIQAKLRVSQPGDADELEADRVADEVVSSAPANLHRKCSCPGGTASCPACEEEEVEQSKGIHRKAELSSDREESVSNDFAQSLGPGQPLDPSMRGFMESRFGRDFERVRVHTDERATKLAQSVNADAFTVGSDLVFGAGKFSPSSDTGSRLLAHELTHVVQQANLNVHGRAPGVPHLQRQGQPSGGAPAVPPWLRGVKVTRHVVGNIYEIQLTGYGPTEVGPYSELSSYLAVQGRSAKEQAHHIVGTEHLEDVAASYKQSDAPCVAFENGTHNAVSTRITSVQNELGGRRGGRPVVSRQEIATLYREVYTVDTNFKELSTISDNVLGMQVKTPSGGTGPSGGGGGSAEPVEAESGPGKTPVRVGASAGAGEQAPGIKARSGASVSEILEADQAISKLRGEAAESVRFSGRLRIYSAAIGALFEALNVLDTISDALKMGTEGTILGPAQKQAEQIEMQAKEAVETSEKLAESMSLFGTIVTIEKARQAENSDQLFALSSSLHDLSDSLSVSVGQFTARARELEARARGIAVMRDVYEKMVSVPVGIGTAANAQAFAMYESLEKLHSPVNSASQSYSRAADNLSAYAQGFGELATAANHAAWQIVLVKTAKARAEEKHQATPPSAAEPAHLPTSPLNQSSPGGFASPGTKRAEPCPNCHRPNVTSEEPKLIDRFASFGSGPGGQLTEEDRKRLLEFLEAQKK